MNNDSLNLIPEDILTAINNAEVFTTLEKIGDTYGLLLDQLGSLDVLTRQVLLGKIKSSLYIETIAKELEISEQTASKIAAEVNTNIFQPLRDSLRKMQAAAEAAPTPVSPTPAPIATPKPPVAPLEKAGDFQVVAPQPSHSPIYNDHSLTKEEVLADLENIKKLKPENAENYVEHLIEAPAIPTPPPAAPEKKKYNSPDPYRESI